MQKQNVYLTGFKSYKGRTNEVYLPEIHSPEDWKSIKHLSRAAKYCCICSGEALKYKNKDTSPLRYDNHRVGIIVGTNITQFEAIYKMAIEAEHYGANNVNPRIFPDTVLNVLSGHLSIYFQIHGTNITISNGKDTEVKSLVYGIDLIEQQEVDSVLICNIMFYPRIIKAWKKDVKVTPEWVTTLVLEKNPIEANPYTRLHYEFENSSYNKTECPYPEFTGLLAEKASKLGLADNLKEDSASVVSNGGVYKFHLSQEGKSQ